MALSSQRHKTHSFYDIVKYTGNANTMILLIQKPALIAFLLLRATAWCLTIEYMQSGNIFMHSLYDTHCSVIFPLYTRFICKLKAHLILFVDGISFGFYKAILHHGILYYVY